MEAGRRGSRAPWGALSCLGNMCPKPTVRQAVDRPRPQFAHGILPPPLQTNRCLHWANTLSTRLQPPDLISTPMTTLTRRPSLPHIYDNLPVPSPSGSCRPRSAVVNENGRRLDAVYCAAIMRSHHHSHLSSSTQNQSQSRALLSAPFASNLPLAILERSYPRFKP
jgi:hypothetical protein